MWLNALLSLPLLIIPSFATPPNLPPDKVSLGYYAAWHASLLPLNKVSWGKYTHLSWAFATLTEDPNVISLPDDEQGLLLDAFVKTANTNHVIPLISLGGWTASTHFSTHLSNSSTRTTLTKTLLSFLSNHNLSGIDIDWEFPGTKGVGCNAFSGDDTANLLLFLQELRSNGGADMTITAAVPLAPWMSTDGKTPTKDVSAFADVLNWITVMDYDVWGSWALDVAPNAPLNDSCTTSSPSPPNVANVAMGKTPATPPTHPVPSPASAHGAVRAWLAAGMPRDKIVLGVAAYGHSFRVEKIDAFGGNNTQTLTLNPPHDPTSPPPGDALFNTLPTKNTTSKYTNNALPEKDVCNVTEGAVGGIYSFRGMIEDGWLTKSNGSVEEGLWSVWDECSQTPFVYNTSTTTTTRTSNIMISYDDPRSMARKGTFVRDNQLRGFGMWEAAGDWGDLLLDAVLSATIHGDPTSANLSVGDVTLNSALPATTGATQSGSNGSAVLRPTKFWVMIAMMGLLPWL